MPTTTSSSVSAVFASSTVITPSLPTFCMAWAIISPISLSPLAEIVPTWAISSEEATLRARPSMSFTAAAVARSMPRFRSIGFMPAATYLAPSRTIAWASTVAVVVPSPAMSLVFEATSRTIWAPMFSNLSASSISLATVTPSLVMRGAPKLFSITTLRPFGPSVTFTASARMSTPRSIFSRAVTENLTSLAAMTLLHKPNFQSWLRRALDLVLYDAHDVGLLHNQDILTINNYFSSGPFSEDHAVASRDTKYHHVSFVVAYARAEGDDFALLGLFLRRIGDDDASLGLLLGTDAPEDDPIVQRTEFHRKPPQCAGSADSCVAVTSDRALPGVARKLGVPAPQSHRGSACPRLPSSC